MTGSSCRNFKNRSNEKILLELISDYSKAVVNEFNTQNLISFLYTINKQVGTEIKTVPFTLILPNEQKQNDGVKIDSLTNGAGTTRYSHAKKKKKSRHRTYTLCKKLSKMDRRPKCNTEVQNS